MISKDNTCYEHAEHYISINGETYWILVRDHFTGIKHGATRINNSSPIEWLCYFLIQYSPACLLKVISHHYYVVYFISHVPDKYEI